MTSPDSLSTSLALAARGATARRSTACVAAATDLILYNTL